jgi:hypothetical protein
MSEIVFPSSPVDGTTFFHGDNVCLYHADDNTWECRAVVSETPTTPTTPVQNVYMTTSKVYTLGDKRTEWQQKLGVEGINFAVPPVQTQQEINSAIFDLICYTHSLTPVTVDFATKAYVDEKIVQANQYAETKAQLIASEKAPMNHHHPHYATKEYVDDAIANMDLSSSNLPDDIPSRAEFTALMTAVMSAIANHD